MSDGLTAFQYDLLAALNNHGGMIGLDLKAYLELERDRYNGEVNHGRLYPNLDILVEGGLVEKSEVDGRTNEYVVTESGSEAVEERVRELGGKP